MLSLLSTYLLLFHPHSSHLLSLTKPLSAKRCISLARSISSWPDSLLPTILLSLISLLPTALTAVNEPRGLCRRDP